MSIQVRSAFYTLLLSTSALLCAQSKTEVIGEVQLANGATRPFVSFGYDTMRYTTYPLKESAELIAGCQKLDSKAPWATIRSLGFVLLSQDEKKIVSACEFCRRSSTDKNVHYSCSYKKADIVFKNGKKLTGVVVSVDGIAGRLHAHEIGGDGHVPGAH